MRTTILNVPRSKSSLVKKAIIFLFAVANLVLLYLFFPGMWNSSNKNSKNTLMASGSVENDTIRTISDEERTADYRRMMTHVINGDSSGRWKISETTPPEGAILPYKRIIAYYGNLYSKQMGILGELPKPEVLKKLMAEAAAWEKADTMMKVQPALHYIAVTAQIDPGKAGKYRLRMPFSQIDTVLKMAEKINAIVFLDIQIGLGSLQEEIPELEKYLKMPHVHLGIDPEFSMKGGQRPGAVIGSFDAADINYATNYMAKIVRDNNLPPKILVIHRFTKGMVTNYQQIKIQPEVQIVMHMDGWGPPSLKLGTYSHFIYKEPVEYAGFKIFYKNDSKNNGRIMYPHELVKLKPQPVYIQYQ